MVGNWAGLIIAIEDKHSSASSGRLSTPRGIFGHLGFYIFLSESVLARAVKCRENMWVMLWTVCHRKGHALPVTLKNNTKTLILLVSPVKVSESLLALAASISQERSADKSRAFKEGFTKSLGSLGSLTG